MFGGVECVQEASLAESKLKSAVLSREEVNNRDGARVALLACMLR